MVEAVVFDLGGVLLDWDPRHLYRKLFPGDAAAMERFLAEVCTPAWNATMDAGRPFAEAVAELSRRFPAEAERIAAYDARWEEMLAGPIAENVALLAELSLAGVPLYALTNFSAEKFGHARDRFDFLEWFAGIVVSGEIGLAKPDPAIFRDLIERFALQPEATVYVDDSAANIATAAALGFRAIHYRDGMDLAGALAASGLPVEAGQQA